MMHEVVHIDDPLPTFLFILQIFYYSKDIFEAAGIQHADIATVITVGLVLVLVTMATVSMLH